MIFKLFEKAKKRIEFDLKHTAVNFSNSKLSGKLMDETIDRTLRKIHLWQRREVANCKPSHLPPLSINFRILYSVRSKIFFRRPLKISETVEREIRNNRATCWYVKSRSKINSLNLSTNSVKSSFFIAVINIMTNFQLVKSFYAKISNFSFSFNYVI